MARSLGVSFRRAIAGPFAGDAPPVGAQVVNVPATGVGVLYRLPLGRRDDPGQAVRRIQGYYTAVGFAGTLTLQGWIAAGDGTAAGDWIQYGLPLPLVPALRLFETVANHEDADLVVQVTPSVPLILGESLLIYLEEIE